VFINLNVCFFVKQAETHNINYEIGHLQIFFTLLIRRRSTNQLEKKSNHFNTCGRDKIIAIKKKSQLNT